MNGPSSQTALAGVALIVLGGLGAGLEFMPIPASNSTLLAAIIGALAGALTVAGGSKIADKLTTSNGPDATITESKP